MAKWLISYRWSCDIVGELHHSTRFYHFYFRPKDHKIGRCRRSMSDWVFEGTRTEAHDRVQAYRDTWKRMTRPVDEAEKMLAKLRAERDDFARSALTGMEPRGSFGPLSEDQCRSLAGIK